MSTQWKSYFCLVNDKLASIALDLSIRQTLSQEKPWLLWVWVYLRFPRPDGLSDRSEFDTISAIEDGLAKNIGSECDAVEVGRITTDGRREFYFYGAGDGGFKAAVSKAMRPFAKYKYDQGSKKDAKWSQYVNVLYPSEEDFEKIKNQDVLEALMKHGDTLVPVRDVHHWVFFCSREDRKWFASGASELGYKTVHEYEERGDQHPFRLQITRDQSVTPDRIDEAVIALFRLAKQVNAEYDGWEAQVVATKN